MTVKDQDVYHATEALILPNPRRHYRATIGTVHWQLRNLISAEKRNFVYYPSGAGNLTVQRLDTDTRQTEPVTILPFLPRCLVAKNSWVCAGGETGEFTAIDLKEDRATPDIATDEAALYQALDSNPDASQLLESSSDLTNSWRVRQSIRTLTQARKNIIGKSRQFGKERVNCITLWFPPVTEQKFEGAYDEPVAVLANNDKSVAIVRLRDQELLTEIQYPDCVNRAVCSPDGRLLVAISDDPYLYVYAKTWVNPHEKDEMGYKPIYNWLPRNKIHLISQSNDDRSDNRGSFAACFSSSGRYLAVGTQYGAISIFDTTSITDPDLTSLLTSFTSSRPNNTLGAVRAMEFAPGPIDLLAWTEDRGRVGIADMRNGCISRQILHLDKEDDYDHIFLSDRGFIDPRLLDSRRTRLRATDAEIQSLAEHLAHGNDPDLLERINQPLSPEETRVLEALQEHSRRREQRTAARVSMSAQRDRLLGASSPATRPSASSSDVASTERRAVVTAAVNEVLGSMRDINEQLEERMRSHRREANINDGDDSPHTRPTPPPTSRPSAGARPGGDDAPSARRALANRLMGDAQQVSTSAWSDLDALWSLSFDSGSTTSPNPTGGRTTEGGAATPQVFGNSLAGGVPRPLSAAVSAATDAGARRRDRAAFLMREWETNPARRMAGLGLRHSIADPFDTAGLAWSEDGRKLFIGAEKGIYEFHVNILNRKFVPSNEPR